MRSAACVAVLLAAGLTVATGSAPRQLGKAPSYIQSAVDRSGASGRRSPARCQSQARAGACLRWHQAGAEGRRAAYPAVAITRACSAASSATQRPCLHDQHDDDRATSNAPPEPPPSGPNPCNNVTASSRCRLDLKLPAGLDVVWTSENYHDLHNASLRQARYEGLRHGRIQCAEARRRIHRRGSCGRGGLGCARHRHAAPDRSGAGQAGSDQCWLRVRGRSDVLHNADDHARREGVRAQGSTDDSFLFKFRKPRNVESARRSTRCERAARAGRSRRSRGRTRVRRGLRMHAAAAGPAHRMRCGVSR